MKFYKAGLAKYLLLCYATSNLFKKRVFQMDSREVDNGTV